MALSWIATLVLLLVASHLVSSYRSGLVPQMEGQQLPPGRYGGYLLVTQVFAK